MGKGGRGKSGAGDVGKQGKGGLRVPSAADLEKELALYSALWTCGSCGCKKNEMRRRRCKHCGTEWTPFQPCSPPMFGAPGGVRSNGLGGSASPFASSGPPGCFALADSGGGTGGAAPAAQARAPANALSREEHATLAELLAKSGDALGAARRREPAKPPPAAKEPALQHQVSKAHSKLRGLERKLQGAAQRFEEWSLQMVEQKGLVTKLTEEVEVAEAEHRRLVAALHEQTIQSRQNDGEAKSVPCSLAAVMDGTFSRQLDIDPSELLVGMEDFELSQADQEELEARGKQLRDGIQELTQKLLAQAKETANNIKEAHEEHLGRLANQEAEGRRA
ncbi:unnamed protein product [Prorocentrum cordatum]|uniref:RanBP2-type domain-containing protein n=1 Tax=Prorocentrum cordatum TaxID=2364126 RepID=A0ABN9SY12_9DINO|nr:unnamed protein product [Polarella glacialis]